MSPAPPESVAALVDAIDNGHAGLDLQVKASGHEQVYGAIVANLRALVAKLRTVLDDRGTGQFPKLERDRRETPNDPEAAKPMDELPRTPIVEYRRRRTKGDDER